MQPRRLFDCIKFQAEHNPRTDMLAAKEGGQWRKYSTQQISDLVNQFSAGLMAMDINCHDMTEEGRDKVAIISKNRPEWIMLDLAVQQIGAVLVPIYPTIHINELEFVLKDAGVRIAFVNDEELYLKVNSLRSKLPLLKEIFCFEYVANARHWKELIEMSTPSLVEQAMKMADKVQYEDLSTIIYTSGTTGIPKGVMLSHKNILSNVLTCIPYFPPGKELRALSFLPLNHIYEKTVSYLYMFQGTSIYYAENMDTIGENLKEVKPDLFSTVPRLLEKVYDKIMQKASELTGLKKNLFFWAMRVAEKFEINKDQGAWYNLKMTIANKLIFSKWREALGGNIKCITTGSAACQVKLIRLFTAAQIVIMEGYGLTETSPVISVNHFSEEGRMFGTVGPLIDEVMVKIAEDGEILCKGPNVMMGYYKQPDLTAESIKDGWFYTGDIGIFVDNKFLKITDRKKELFKTSGGKYVAPLPIENKLKESPFVEQIIVVGSERKFVGALIVPSFTNLQAWCRKKGVSFSSEEDILHQPEVIQLMRDQVESFNKFFNHVEQIKQFELLPMEWTIDGGELTPTLKLKRKVIMEKYKDAIERIYF